MIRNTYIALLILSASILSPSTLSASAFPDPFDDFFDREEPLHITLEFDIKTYQATREAEEYQEAKLIYIADDSTTVSYPVRLKTRGVFRKSFCVIPPFWMNIRKSGIAADALAGVTKIKVVTHCNRREFYQDYVLKEYLAYKLYNIISPYSFRVRLLRITFIDTGRNNQTTEAWAFAIEHKQQLAARMNADIIEDEKLSRRNMNPTYMDKLALFNYMIGNTDYSITGLHNVELLKPRDAEPAGIIPVPYDFDFTGFVDAVYARPSNNSYISDIHVRRYTGLCRPDAVFEKLVEEFGAKSREIHLLLQQFPYLSLEQKMEMLRFVESFYTELAMEDFIERKLKPSCD